MNLIVTGQPETAIPALREALRLDPLESRTPYLNVLGIAYYTAGYFTEALDTFEYNTVRGGPRGPHMDVFVAASYTRLGRESEARSVLEEMMREYPEFPAEAWISNWLRHGEQLQKTLDVLQKLGLE
jgi:tetratricopeptide (TPR) repeat protein